MTALPESLKRLVKELSELPAIGPRQATRLALYLAGQKKLSEGLLGALTGLQGLKNCSRCLFFYEGEGDLCEICANDSREKSLIAIVEKETDLISIENTGKFKGRYLVIGEVPKTGLLENWQKDRIETLKSFIEKELGGKAREIVIATNPTSLGDFHAGILANELSPLAEKISRLGRGLPTGGEIEFADDETLGSALDARS